jgi:hypothetical protein
VEESESEFGVRLLSLNNDCRHIRHSSLFSARFLIQYSSALFLTFFLVDVLADGVGYNNSLPAVVLLALVPLISMATGTFFSLIYKGICGSSEEEAQASASAPTTPNPIQARSPSSIASSSLSSSPSHMAIQVNENVLALHRVQQERRAGAISGSSNGIVNNSQRRTSLLEMQQQQQPYQRHQQQHQQQ